MEGAITSLNKCIDPVPGNKTRAYWFMLNRYLAKRTCHTEPALTGSLLHCGPALLGSLRAASTQLLQRTFRTRRARKLVSYFPHLKATYTLYFSMYPSFVLEVWVVVVLSLHFSRLFTCVQGSGATAMTSCCRCASAQLRVFAPWTWSWSQEWQTTSQVQKVPLFIDVLAVAWVDFHAVFQMNCCGFWIVNLKKSLTLCTDPSTNNPTNYNRWLVDKGSSVLLFSHVYTFFCRQKYVMCKRQTFVTVLTTLFVIGWTWSQSTGIFSQTLVIPRWQPCILGGEQLLTTSSTAQDATSVPIKEVGGCDVESRGQVLLLLIAAYTCLLFPGTPGFVGEGLKLTGSLSLLSEDVLWSLNGLPNLIMPSDHLSLLAKFQMDLAWVEKCKRP